MKKFLVQTSDSMDATIFVNQLLSMKSVERVDVIEKENWAQPGRPASDAELEAMVIEAEQAGFVSIQEVKNVLDTLHNPQA